MSPDGAKVVFNIGDGLEVYDIASQSGIHVESGVPESNFVLSPNGRHLVVRNNADTAFDFSLFDLDRMRKVAQIPRFTNDEYLLLISDDGTRLVTTNFNGDTILRDGRDGSRIANLGSGQYGNDIIDSLITPDQSYAEIVRRDGVARYKLADGKLDREIALPYSYIRAVYPGGLSIAWVDGAGKLFVTDLQSCQARFGVPVAKSLDDVEDLQITVDGKRIIAASRSKQTLVDAKSGKVINSWLVPWREPPPVLPVSGWRPLPGPYPSGFVQSPDGRFIVRPVHIEPQTGMGATPGDSLYVFDSRTLGLLANLPGTFPVDLGSDGQPFSCDGRRMLTENTKRIALWDTSTWNQTSEIYASPPSSAVWLPDGSLLTENYDSGTDVRIWTRHRPEAWYAIAVLPQFWLALVATIFTLARIYADLNRWYHPVIPAGVRPG